LTYDLSSLLDGLKINFGYRYTKDHRELKQQSRINNACTLNASDPKVDYAACELNLAKNFGSSSFTIGFDYQLAPDVLVYLTHRKGYRSGGLNSQGAAVGRSVYAPEHVSDVEAGIKADWHFDGGTSARTNLAVFRTKRDDAQVSESFTAVVNGTTQSLNLIVNKATATIKGVEFDGLVSFPFGLDLSAAWAYTDATYDSYLDITQTPAHELSNQPYPFSPRNKTTLGARYKLPVSGNYGDVSAALNWSHSSAIKFNVAPDPYGDQAAYSQTDLFLNWNKAMNSPVDLALFVTNLTDTKYKIGGFPVYYSVGFSTGVYNEPRMWGVSAKYRFGGQ
jgi:iron complex outermembrane recepter protein